MDSLTQIALGAAIGETVAGDETGNKAMLWGGIAGLIPDLDVVMGPFYTQTEYLLAHRGISHSLVFAILFSPLLAYFAFRVHRSKGVSFKKWWLLVFLAVFTHPILDIMTIYGTGFLEPFSNARLALGNINIVDPVYSLPLMLSLICIAVMRKRVPFREIIIGAMIFSHVYLGITLVNRFYTKDIFKESLAENIIHYDSLTITPTFLNNIMWAGAAVGKDYAWVGHYSHLDADKDIEFHRVPRNLALAAHVSAKDYTNLVRFSKGFYVLSKKEKDIFFHDLRFGHITPAQFVFNFNFSDPESRPFGVTENGDTVAYFKRILGE